jgi:hypothetical protein
MSWICQDVDSYYLCPTTVSDVASRRFSHQIKVQGEDVYRTVLLVFWHSTDIYTQNGRK